jgi:beta-phosphoglucomutase-like phosphatase (HAD superfamily)
MALKHLVMFDVDGTLVDSAGFDGRLYARAVREELGVRVDETWRSYRHVTDSGILEELLQQHAPASERDTLGARVKSRFVALVRAFIADGGRSALYEIPGAGELLRQLRGLPDVVVAIATGGWRETAELKLNAVGIEFMGLPFATASEATSRIEIIRLAEQQALPQGPFSRRTYFGDTPWDKRASEEPGL